MNEFLEGTKKVNRDSMICKIDNLIVSQSGNLANIVDNFKIKREGPEDSDVSEESDD
jgi:hypothetical protein